MSRTPLPRPTLLPGLSRVWRGPHVLQVGLDPARAVLVDLPDPRAARVLDLLDNGHPERAVLARAMQLDVPAEQARTLLDTLHTAGLVVGAHTLMPQALPHAVRQRLAGEAAALALRDAGHPPAKIAPNPAQVLRRRAAARVVLTGRGRLGAAVAVALAQAGVGHIHPDLPGTVTSAELAGGPLTAGDVGRPRGEAVTAALHRVAPDVQTRPVRRGAATLVVQLSHDQPVALLSAGHAQRRQPHLALAIREGTAVVGPLVPPAGGPCLNCLELHRTERDADWPGIAAQLRDTAPEPCAVATVLAATAYATAEALTLVDGGTPETLGAAVEISAPGRFRRRTWTPHPRCDCGRRRMPRRVPDVPG
jgi:bacteriocin biosynthesis cyclodehydratase domain-containing protein